METLYTKPTGKNGRWLFGSQILHNIYRWASTMKNAQVPSNQPVRPWVDVFSGSLILNVVTPFYKLELHLTKNKIPKKIITM